MTIEAVGRQLRIRVRFSRGAKRFGVQVLSPRLQRVGAKYDGWETQSWRVSLDKFRTLEEALRYIERRFPWLTKSEMEQARREVRKWWRENK